MSSRPFLLWRSDGAQTNPYRFGCCLLVAFGEVVVFFVAYYIVALRADFEPPSKEDPWKRSPVVLRLERLGLEFDGDGTRVLSVATTPEVPADADLSALCNLPDLKRAGVGDSIDPAKTLSILGRCKSLREIRLFFRELRDDDLQYLTALPQLSHLKIQYGEYSDKGLEYIGQIENLVSLDLEVLPTAVVGPGLGYLSRLGKLERLIVGESRITDAGVAHLLPVQQLRFLSLCETGVTDAGVATLAKLRNLRELDLRGTKITPKCLASLAEMKELRMVDLDYTSVRKADVAELRRVKPDLDICVERWEIHGPDEHNYGPTATPTTR
jgi:hypothetical protein